MEKEKFDNTEVIVSTWAQTDFVGVVGIRFPLGNKVTKDQIINLKSKIELLLTELKQL